MTRTIHFSHAQPGATGRARAVCGLWSSRITSDPKLVTCLSCSQIIRRKPPTKPESNNVRSLLLTLTTALLVAACDRDEHTSTDHVETHDGPCNEDSSSGSEPTSRDTETDDTCPAGTAYGHFGAFCDGEAGCALGMVCIIHPDFGWEMCSVPCKFLSCAEAEPYLCPGASLENIECRTDASPRTPWCFPKYP